MIDNKFLPIGDMPFELAKYPVIGAEWHLYCETQGKTLGRALFDRPVTNVTWYEAADYAEWAGARLPYEWELAYAEHRSDAKWNDDFWPLGEKPTVDDPRLSTSRDGVVGLYGLAMCWCIDGEASYRVIRGGSWRSDPRYARVALRNWGRPSWRYDNLGFRLVRSP